jgi:sec-independent protein translocase protein TatC
MFRFLLSSGDTAPIKARVERARAVEAEALRFARSGDFDRAANLADGEMQRLTALGDGRISAPDRFAGGVVELQARLDAQGRLVDATRDGLGLGAAPALRQSLERRMEAVDAFQSGSLGKASEALEQSASLLAGAAGSQGSAVARVWKMQKTLSAGQESLSEEAWTRPLLTMSEQLSPGADAPARPGRGVRAADHHGSAVRAGCGQVEVPAEVPATRVHRLSHPGRSHPLPPAIR